MTNTEQRGSQRVVFTEKDRVKGVIKPQSEDQEIITQIINLSIGGIHFIVNRGNPLALKTGDQVELMRIQGIQQLASLTTITAEIKWVLDHDFLDHLGLGCEFKNLSKDQQQLIDTYIGSQH